MTMNRSIKPGQFREVFIKLYILVFVGTNREFTTLFTEPWLYKHYT